MVKFVFDCYNFDGADKVLEARRIYLLRHGKLELKDNLRRYIGQLDVPLNEEGISKARDFCRKLKNVDYSAVYCSDLTRSRQTAEIIAASPEIAVIIDERLREIHFGKWEGKTVAEVAQKCPRSYSEWGSDLSYYRVPGGESYADCSRRVVAAFQDILSKSTGNILISGHIDVNRLILCHVLGLPIKNLFRISQRHGCINIILSTNNDFRVELINSINGR